MNTRQEARPPVYQRPSPWVWGLFLALALPISPAMAQTGTYTIRLGDTLWGIARNQGLSLEQIFSLNPGLRSNPDLILIGQVLRVPAPVQSASVGLPPKPVRTTSQRRSAFSSLNLPATVRQGNRVAAARRGPGCAVSPQDKPSVLLPTTNFGLTLQDYPTFFWYLPALTAANIPVSFQLREASRNGAVLYETTFPSPGSGLSSLTLPPEAPPLKEGQEYEWSITVQCKEEPDTWMTAFGRIQRMSTDNPSLTSALSQAPLEDYPAILAEAGVWYDALQTLAALRRTNPTSLDLSRDWVGLLERVGFSDIAEAPFQCVQPRPDGGLSRCSP
ncbi:MAG: DUF928 domain-containing protein [Gloeomargaritaceae cyanobacterium C42_A2020_066]|nr:DUF928 domain-containing protein [Gloeomargaritaceae cyanobacterium C42_A2020_066]